MVQIREVYEHIHLLEQVVNLVQRVLLMVVTDVENKVRIDVIWYAVGDVAK